MQGEGAAVVLLDTDLFFVVKVRTTLQHAGYDVRTARSSADFARRLTDDTPVLALVNTAVARVDWREAIGAARTAGIPVIAFGSHVDLETQQAARAAGATRVIANSRLASDLPGIVARTLRTSSHESGASTGGAADVDSEDTGDERDDDTSRAETPPHSEHL
jgi:DNA-binding NtrC family response regulator